MFRLGFLASHRGTNMQAVIDACRAGRIPAQPVVVISNNRLSGALKRAAAADIDGYHLSSKTHPDPAHLDTAILQALRKHKVDLVILTGYLKKIGPKTLPGYRGRIINIHPSLLPKYGGPGMYGLRIHEAVLAARERTTGVTIHRVEGAYDEGAVLAQNLVPVKTDDTPESLAARVLEVEHTLLVETVRKIAKGEIPIAHTSR
jgi:phosphoribosylglycinamide formyltransferase 1